MYSNFFGSAITHTATTSCTDHDDTDEGEEEAGSTKMPSDEGDGGATKLEELEARIRSLELEAAEAEDWDEEEGHVMMRGRKQRGASTAKAKLNEAFLASSGQAAPGMLACSAGSMGVGDSLGSSAGSYEKLQTLLARIDDFQQECQSFDPSTSGPAAAVTTAAAAPAQLTTTAIRHPTGLAASASGDGDGGLGSSWDPSLGLSGSDPAGVSASSTTPLFSASAHARQLDDLEQRLEALTALIHDESLRVPPLATMRV